MNVCITRGLIASDKEYVEVPVAEIDAYLKKHRNCYERTFPLNEAKEDDVRKYNRVYVDIDGKVASTMSGGEFAGETRCRRVCDDVVVAETQTLLPHPFQEHSREPTRNRAVCPQHSLSRLPRDVLPLLPSHDRHTDQDRQGRDPTESGYGNL